MITVDAILNGDKNKLLSFDPFEMPVALQLGGSDPTKLAEATSIGVDFGYQEINLNIGCPSDRVQSGCFGAVLMKDPDLVLNYVSKMKLASSGVPITVKCRIGVDDQEPQRELPKFIERVSSKGVDSFTIHARKAILKGLSPKQNREIPPLDYGLVQIIKEKFPNLKIYLNGGVENLGSVNDLIKSGLDGVMIGRAVYKNPGKILLDADSVIFGDDLKKINHFSRMNDALEKMLPYIEQELSKGTRLSSIIRHLAWSFTGLRGSAKFRKTMSMVSSNDNHGAEILYRALNEVKSVQSSED